IRLDQAVNTTRTLHATLLQRLQETDVVKGAQLSNATVVDPAELPTKPSEPNTPFNLAFGLLFGGGLGLALVFAMATVDRPLKTPADVRPDRGLPPLAVVPAYDPLAAGPLRLPPAVMQLHIPPSVLRIPARVLRMPALARGWPPRSRGARGWQRHGRSTRSALHGATPTAEAYRSIRTSVLSFNPKSPPRSLLVTSSQPR